VLRREPPAGVWERGTFDIAIVESFFFYESGGSTSGRVKRLRRSVFLCVVLGACGGRRVARHRLCWWDSRGEKALAVD